MGSTIYCYIFKGEHKDRGHEQNAHNYGLKSHSLTLFDYLPNIVRITNIDFLHYKS